MSEFVSAKTLTATAAHLALASSRILREVSSSGSGNSLEGLVDKVWVDIWPAARGLICNRRAMETLKRLLIVEHKCSS